MSSEPDALMAECLEEARALLDDFDKRHGVVAEPEDFEGYDLSTATIAAALYAERCRQQRNP